MASQASQVPRLLILGRLGRVNQTLTYGDKTTTNINEFILGVPSVPEGVEGEAGLPPTAAGEHLPYLTPGGTLVIPFDSPERYHWWKPPHDQRLRVKEIIAELKARQEEAAHGAAF